MASPPRRILGSPTSLTDDLLEEIFLRLPEAADLARAAAACATFRRVITDDPFLRRFRALHPPPLLGILSTQLITAQPPHPSAAVARAFAYAEAADFMCSFLPSRDHWRLRDFRDGRALLSSVPEGTSDTPRVIVKDLAVCDPLHRRYLLLPAIPDGLVASVHQPDVESFEPFLAPAGEDEQDQHMSFRVMCLAQCSAKLVLFVFSSSAGQWSSLTFDGWSAITEEHHMPGSYCALGWRRYAHGCFCWGISRTNKIDKLLVLDTNRMEFSSSDIPQIHQVHQNQIATVEAVEGRLGMFILCVEMEYGVYYLLYAIMQNDRNGVNKWETKKIIPLPVNNRYNIMGVAGGYLLLQGIPADHYLIPAPERPNLDCFSVNLQTLQLEWFCGTRYAIILAQLYAGYPPSLSPPTI